MSSPLEQLRLDHSFGFIDRSVQSDQLFHPLLIDNAGSNQMLRAIRHELGRSKSFIFSVAFVTTSAVAMLKQAMLDFPGAGTIITSTYLGFNSPAAFRELLNLPGVDVYVHSEARVGFHAKGYVFEQANSTTAIVGSSNLTPPALLSNREWNLRFSALPDGDIVDQVRRAIQAQISSATLLTAAWIDDYESTYVPPERRPRALALVEDGNADFAPIGQIVPNSMQAEALQEIQKLRDAGERRAVVVSATGTGKTILSALDVRAVAPERMLFIVHREQILDRAIEEFRRVLGAPADEFGKFVGSRRDINRKYVFATIQSLGNDERLRQIPPNHFDYVLVDEVHRAGAASYRRVIDHLAPGFLLGMTATPERTDGFNVFEMFDFNVPYEIRLQKALEEDMLAPFHYYGVTEFVRDDVVIDDTSQLAALVAPERADHIVDAIETYGHVGVPVRGLMFCSRTDEARELVALLNARSVHGSQLRTIALTGQDPIEAREAVVQRLERGELDYIVTVDVFNEGIDIPSVNQVVMLRQTKSSIIFTQQLGRGLRKAAGKDHLVVIDFIGNYANNYLIPIALFGDNSLNKDSLRKKMLDAQEAGSISGLSSVNFDRIARDRIFASIASASLDSMVRIKGSIAELANRLGHAPRLMDFARFDAADPVALATKRSNYWSLLRHLKYVSDGPSGQESMWLTFLSTELLSGKRPHELLLLETLLTSSEITVDEYRDLLRSKGCSADEATVNSAIRLLTLDFFKPVERRKYGAPLVTAAARVVTLNPLVAEAIVANDVFREHLTDALDTGLYLARHRYHWTNALVVGQTYSTKDVCRLLNWKQNEQATMFGYKVDYFSKTCPIFVTYHKSEAVSESTAYGDEFINESAMHWFSKSGRTLESRDVRSLIKNEVDIHLFVQRDKNSPHFYVGRARSSEAIQTRMPGRNGDGPSVVTMTLGMASALEASLYDYFSARLPE